jgi:hypothetical protein
MGKMREIRVRRAFDSRTEGAATPHLGHRSLPAFALGARSLTSGAPTTGGSAPNHRRAITRMHPGRRSPRQRRHNGHVVVGAFGADLTCWGWRCESRFVSSFLFSSLRSLRDRTTGRTMSSINRINRPGFHGVFLGERVISPLHPQTSMAR